MSARRANPRAPDGGRPAPHAASALHPRLRWLALVALAALVFACNSLLGLTDFQVTPDATDASDDVVAADGAVTCTDGGAADVNLAEVCYPCTPVVTEQFLNACTGAQCVPFDRARVTRLLPDGALPPLPPDPDAG